LKQLGAGGVCQRAPRDTIQISPRRLRGHPTALAVHPTSAFCIVKKG
jgi:hypothetical protein